MVTCVSMVCAGHGYDNNQCAEFCITSHHFMVNGIEHVLNFTEAGKPWGCADKVSCMSPTLCSIRCSVVVRSPFSYELQMACKAAPLCLLLVNPFLIVYICACAADRHGILNYRILSSFAGITNID